MTDVILDNDLNGTMVVGEPRYAVFYPEDGLLQPVNSWSEADDDVEFFNRRTRSNLHAYVVTVVVERV